MRPTLISLAFALLILLTTLPAQVKAAACSSYSEDFSGGLDGAIWRVNGMPAINNDQLVTEVGNTPLVSEIITNASSSGDGEVRVTVDSFTASQQVSGNFSVIASLGLMLNPDTLVAVYWEKYFNTNYLSIGIKENGLFRFVDAMANPANNDKVTLILQRSGSRFTGRYAINGGVASEIGAVTSSNMSANSELFSFIHTELTNLAPGGFASEVRYDSFAQSCGSNNTVAKLPVYRFWSDAKQTHFYTITVEERDTVIATYPEFIWKYEGPRFAALEYTGSCASSYAPVYRFWSDRLQRHFYTIDESERDFVNSELSSTWNRFEGARFCAAKTQIADSTPIYRFWSDRLQSHFYTISEAEKSSVLSNLANVWNHFEGIRYFAYSL